MAGTRSTGSASPASRVTRGLRTASLGALCVLLPMTVHLLAQGHIPRWLILAGLAGVAGACAAFLSRRRLTDEQILVALAGAQLAYQAAYALPGVCAAVGASGGSPSAAGHATVSGAPPEAFLAGHLIMVFLAARLLGVADRLHWHTQPVLAAVEALFHFIWPLLIGSGVGPKPTLRSSKSDALPRSALFAGLNTGRAPPRGRRGLHGHAPLLDRAAARRWSPYALAA